jgi:hypothetical protein
MDKCYCTNTFKCPLCIYQEEFEIKQKEQKIQEEVDKLYTPQSEYYQDKFDKK